jgi:hypothetical protein
MLVDVKWHLIVVLPCISRMTNDIEHILLLFSPFFATLRIEPRDLYMVGKCSTTKLYP